MSENLDTIEYDPEHPQEHTDLWNELCAEAERFFKGGMNVRKNIKSRDCKYANILHFV